MADHFPLWISIGLCTLVTLLSFMIRSILYTLDAAPYTDSGFKYLSPDWSGANNYPVYVNTVYVTVFLFGTLYLILQNPFRWIILRRMCFLTSCAQVIYFIQLGVTRFPDPNPALHDQRLLFDMYHVVYVVCFLIVQFYEHSSVLRTVYLPGSLFGLWLLIPTHMFYTIDILTACFSVLCVFFIYHWYVRNTVAISKRKFLVWFESDALEFLLKEDEIYHKKLVSLASRLSASSAAHQHQRRHSGSGGGGGHVASSATATATSAAGGGGGGGGTSTKAAATSPQSVIPSLQFFSSGTAEYQVKLEIPHGLNDPRQYIQNQNNNNNNASSAGETTIKKNNNKNKTGATSSSSSSSVQPHTIQGTPASQKIGAAGVGDGLAVNLVGTASSDESMQSRNTSPMMKSSSTPNHNSVSLKELAKGEQGETTTTTATTTVEVNNNSTTSEGQQQIQSDAKTTPTSSELEEKRKEERRRAENALEQNQEAMLSVDFISSLLFNPFRSPSFLDAKIKADVFQRAEERLVRFVRATYTEKQKTMHVWGTAIMGGALGAVAGFANLGAVQITDVERPIGVPLPRDFIFEHLPKVWDHTADVMVYTLLAFTGLLMLFRKERFTILRRTGTLYFCIMILRVFTVTSTFPVDPSPICAHRQHPPGTTCGDLIFSGHTVALLLASLVWSDYFDNKYIKNYFVTGLVWIYTLIGLLMVVLSKLHYTRDVLTAAVVVTAFYHMFQVSVFLRPDVLLRHSWLRWFELDQYIVLEQEGKYLVGDDDEEESGAEQQQEEVENSKNNTKVGTTSAAISVPNASSPSAASEGSNNNQQPSSEQDATTLLPEGERQKQQEEGNFSPTTN